MTQTHALYMEHKAIATAIEVGRYETKNGNTGNRPHTPDPLKADCEEPFYTLDVLLSTLGQPIFESLSINNKIAHSEEPSHAVDTKSSINIETPITKPEPMLFYSRTGGTSAEGYYVDDGFVIPADSLIRQKTVPSIGSWALNKRSQMLTENKLINYDNESYKLIENLLCKTPSGACDFVIGSSNSGWNIWKNAEGQTLDSIYR